jgi:LmbE family N-acetylglucosaminyl deacetylase
VKRGSDPARAPQPTALTAPPRGRVLVFAPHADDEIIGCGGTLALHASQGDPVRVVIAFDGAQGLPKGTDASVRRDEALRGGKHLGVRDYRFLGYPEGHEPDPEAFSRASEHLARELDEFAPEFVYAPWIGEHLLDHHVLARAVDAAIALGSTRPEVWDYEVWTPLVAERVVDVTGVWEKKLAALREHATQLAHTDLVHKALGLAAHRSLYLGKDARFGEAFRRRRVAALEAGE